VKLATDIYRPAKVGAVASERLPVLLHRTPYDKSDPAAVAIAETLAKHGYVVIVQDTRGRHRSEGVFVSITTTMRMTASIPSSGRPSCLIRNGKVGMYGTSYAAHTQADAAKLNPPHLTTLVLNMGGMSNAWNHSVRYDGAFEMGTPAHLGLVAGSGGFEGPHHHGHALQGESQRLVLRTAASQGQSPLAVAPNYEGYYLDEATQSDYDEHWQTLGMQWEKYYGQTADIPMRTSAAGTTFTCAERSRTSARSPH